MTLTAALDHGLDPLPDAWLDQTPAASLTFLTLALLSWAAAEATMAPVLKSLFPVLLFFYAACFFLFIGWYFRISRLFAAPWVSYSAAVAPMAWTLTPLHLMFPTALVAIHLGLGGVLMYELMKVIVILLVVARISDVFQRLNHWPRWAAVTLTVSPLAVAFAGMVFLFFLGGFGMLAIGFSAFKS